MNRNEQDKREDTRKQITQYYDTAINSLKYLWNSSKGIKVENNEVFILDFLLLIHKGGGFAMYHTDFYKVKEHLADSYTVKNIIELVNSYMDSMDGFFKVRRLTLNNIPEDLAIFNIYAGIDPLKDLQEGKPLKVFTLEEVLEFCSAYV